MTGRIREPRTVTGELISLGGRDGADGAPDLARRDPRLQDRLAAERPEIWHRTHKMLDVKDYLLSRCTGGW